MKGAVVSSERIQILYIRDLLSRLISGVDVEIPQDATDLDALKAIRHRLAEMVGEE